MTSKTRNFAVASLLVLGAGLGTGLFAYYSGFPTSAIAPAGGPDELKYLPSNATLVAFADVHEVMTSEVRQKLQTGVPFHGQGQRSFEEQTGINIETDVDRVVFGLTPLLEMGQHGTPSGLVVARGRFNAVKIESWMRERGARVEDYKGKRIITAEHTRPSTNSSQPQQLDTPPPSSESVSIAFIEPGLVAVGQSALVRRSIDLKDGGDNVIANEELMNRVHALGPGNVWAVGRFDALTSQARLSTGVMGQLPAINWFSVNGQVDTGVSGTFHAETHDDESANGLRDVVRGFMALARMQTSSKPELQPLLQSLQLGGAGKVVMLSFDLTPQILDILTRSAASAGSLPKLPRRPNL
jgi:hypothetical protein